MGLALPPPNPSPAGGAEAREPADTPRPHLLARVGRGSVVAARYELGAPLGHGGMGIVYEAIDRVTDRLRAIKLSDGDDADNDALERFRREAVIAGRVESPHVVEVFDAGHDRDLGVRYLVMERLRGEDVGTRLRRAGPFAPEEAWPILAQVARGLDALHAEGIVHRDVKPENVFLTSAGVRIVDLGLARSFAGSVLQTTRAVGTPLFMAPEQLSGEGDVDHRADVYAFAHLAFAMLVGQAYHAVELEAQRGNVYALMARLARGAREPASSRARRLGRDLDPAFDAWFARAASADPGARFESCGDALDALRGAPRAARRDPAPLRSGARLGGIAAAVLAVAVVAVLGATWARGPATVARATHGHGDTARRERVAPPAPPAGETAVRGPLRGSPAPPAALRPARDAAKARAPVPSAAPRPAPTPPAHDPLDAM